MGAERVGILAVQGAFAEHERMLSELGVECIELRQASDLHKGFDRLVLPGGESTAQGRMLRELGMLEPLRDMIEAGMPTFGTCAGLILMAERIDGINGDGSAVDSQHNATWLGTLPVTVRRNAYGRQLGSFRTRADFDDAGAIPMTFIRAPFVVETRDGCDVLARVDGNIVGVRWRNQIGTSFHPELDEDARVHRMFLSL
ncbi:pyridoxal 5'-phosphate synthase glutaminase subunit PdxT [Slackia exigua]|uniref:Pyridoxal 5'-phosphate synthase subunit PdxT n=1 Tax=Slackia exigua (strain ATCC 700122 / DSM 15923 / CIP 105133 / JCM 11022 / KCTC 5966 / S-7) TaxID=649764 RepID=D0WI52_SLAES|nr:pyridoxal 5'-phosphate synthase glutaminase subunit PdxT [Slackia exigua]EEZ60719.1 pyridoxal 5'-phosphate synthase, glutaminase subunit Pdx2 [Slackia exigua ATCC 700122]STO00054.1 Glutamine amidotransferase subunit pdxT [Slackia exigua]